MRPAHGQRLTFLRHAFGFIGGSDSFEQKTGSGITGLDRGSRFAALDRRADRIQSQTLLLQRAVTSEATLRRIGLICLR